MTDPYTKTELDDLLKRSLKMDKLAAETVKAATMHSLVLLALKAKIDVPKVGHLVLDRSDDGAWCFVLDVLDADKDSLVPDGGFIDDVFEEGNDFAAVLTTDGFGSEWTTTEGVAIDDYHGGYYSVDIDKVLAKRTDILGAVEITETIEIVNGQITIVPVTKENNA